MPNRLATFLLFLLLPLLLAGCLEKTPDSQSRFQVSRYFADEGAQWLAVAAEKGDAREVRRLMREEGVNPDLHFDIEGSPLLVWPIFTKSPEGLKAMLENGADPNAATLHPAQDDERFKGRNRNNAMVWAVWQSDPVYLQLLLDHGGDPDTRNSNGETLFFQAHVSGDQWQNIQLLVERGADINALTFTYPIAWNYSSGGGFGRVYWLLQHGADPRAGAHGNPLRYPIIDDIFWHPGGPQVEKWQRLCQQWLLQHGYQRTPMPEHYRKMRKTYGFPSEEKDIPLL